MLQLTAGSAALVAGRAALAQGAPMVNESDQQAVALGYAADSNKVDPKKYPRHVAGQTCAGCQLFTGKAGDVSGPCGIFPGKAVSAKGWCSAWVKKA
ncbi:MAG: high-potential iron-sulfur protein [Hydrogenophaga sp.]|nr:high-potential iron-sulfur protein [Hydrogenophaga sp.]